MKYNLKTERLRTCDVCKKETNEWIIEVIPNKIFKTYCQECFMKMSEERKIAEDNERSRIEKHEKGRNIKSKKTG